MQQDTPSRPRAIVTLIAATILLPLAVMALGLWEGRRGDADSTAFEAERLRLERAVADLEARAPTDGRIDLRMRFQSDGQTYVGTLALDQARAARDQAATMASVMDWRRRLPPVAVVGGGVAAALSLFILIAGTGLGWAARASREALARGFSLMRRLLPAMLAAQILALAAGFVAVVVFEAAMLAHPGIRGGEIKLLMAAGVVVMAVIYMVGVTVVGLRRALAAFEPDPLPIFGRKVPAEEAPGLWRLTEDLADRLGAAKPDTIVVGLTDSYFVTAGPAVLQPGGEQLTGRTLYLPLAHLALMRPNETAAVIAHELAHYAGGDLAYSERFMPIYAGVERSLDAVAASREGSFGLLAPSMRLGVFVMERFHLCVMHWSRGREFAADAAGADATSAEASARALLRNGAMQPRVVETLDWAAEAPNAAPVDLVAEAVAHAARNGLDDPAGHLEAAQAHPTDTHPPTRERVAALGIAVDADLLAAASEAPASDALGVLDAYFLDAEALSRTATSDFLNAIRDQNAEMTAHLQEMAAQVDAEERVLRENGRAMAIFYLGCAVLFAAVAIALLALGVPGLPQQQLWIVCGVVLAIAAGFAAYGAIGLKRGDRVTLVVKPDGLAPPGLDREIAWSEIAGLDLNFYQNRMITRLMLAEGPLPKKIRGGRFAKVDAKRRTVTLTFGLPRRMKPEEFADLIGRYQQAAQARHILSGWNPDLPPPSKHPGEAP